MVLDQFCRWKKTAEILWLTSVAGAGKTTVAHTIAQRCEDEGFLSSSFFFDRNIAGRNVSTKLFSTIARDFADRNADFGEQVADKKKSLVEAPPPLHFAELIRGPSQCLPLDKPVVIIIDALDEGCDREVLTIFRDKVPKLPGTFRVLLTSRMTRDLEFFLSKKPHIFPMSIYVDDDSNITDAALYARHKLREVAMFGNLDEDWPGSLLLDDFILKAGGLFIWVFIVSEYLLESINPDAKLKVLLSKQSSSKLSAETKMDEMYSTIIQTCKWDDEDFVQGYYLLMGAIIAAKTPLSMLALESLHRHDLSMPVRNYLRPLAPLLTNLDNDNTVVKILHLSLKEFLTIRAQSFPTSQKLFLSEVEHSGRLGILCLMVMNEDLNKCGSALGYLKRSSELTGVPDIGENVISEELLYACTFWMDHIVEMERLEPMLVVALHKFLGNYVVPWLEVVTSKGRFQDLAKVRGWIKKTYPENTTFKNYIFNCDVADAFHNISTLLSRMDRREEAYQAIMEAVELNRQLAIDHPTECNYNLAHSLYDLSLRLSGLGHRENALDTIREAVELYRQLAKDRPAVFKSYLARSINCLSLRLSDLGHEEEALNTIREAVEIHQQLGSVRPSVPNPDLANSFNNLGLCLSNMGYRDEALDAIREAVKLYRQLAKDRPAVFNGDLASSLNNFSVWLSNLGHREEALDVIQEAVKLYRHLANDRPAVFNAVLARSLHNLSTVLSVLGYRDDALDAIREAVKLRRHLSDRRPAVFIADLAMSLDNLSNRMLDMGLREEALDTIREAVMLYRQLARDRPAVFNARFAHSLNSLSNRMLDVGHREEALDTIIEAVVLYRQLASDLPAAWNASLACSLTSLSDALSSLGHLEEALGAGREAVKLYRQLVDDLPAVFNADLARALNNLSLRLSDSGHREEALDAIREAVKLRRQLADDLPAVSNADLAHALNDLSVHLSSLGHQEDALDASREAVELFRQLVDKSEHDHPSVYTAKLAHSLHTLFDSLSDLGYREDALYAIRETVELYRYLTHNRSSEYTAKLMDSLHAISNHLSGLGHEEEARYITLEADALRPHLVGKD